MTEYIDVLMGRSPKLADLCLQVEEEYMSDVHTSKWATYGIHSVFLCGDRIAYQAEILLGVGITECSPIALWEGAGTAYLLHFLIYGPEDKFDRKVWKIIGVEPDYKANIYTPMDFYVKFVWKAAGELEKKLLTSDIRSICRLTMQNSKYVSGKTDFSVYPAFAPELKGANPGLTISEVVQRMSELSTEDCKKLPLETRGEARYCIGRAKQVKDKLIVSTHSDARVSVFSRGEHIFDETLLATEVGGLLPYDIARMRRILGQYDR